MYGLQRMTVSAIKWAKMSLKSLTKVFWEEQNRAAALVSGSRPGSKY